MLNDFISKRIREEFPHEPTEQQAKLVLLLGEFVTLARHGKAFLLKGYAGTGKTSVISALVQSGDKSATRDLVKSCMPSFGSIEP